MKMSNFAKYKSVCRESLHAAVRIPLTVFLHNQKQKLLLLLISSVKLVLIHQGNTALSNVIHYSHTPNRVSSGLVVFIFCSRLNVFV